MRILDRYIGRTVIASSLTMLLALVSIFSFFKFLDELENVGQGRYGIPQVIEYIALSTPYLAYQLFPMAALVGALLGLGVLVKNSEITAMRAAGVSLPRIVAAVLKASLLLMLLAVIIGEFIAPVTEEEARTGRSIAMADQITLKSRYGFWSRDGSSYINIRRILPGDQIESIYIYEFDQSHRLRTSTYARRATYQEGRWLLEDIQQSIIGDESVTRREAGKAAWDSLLRPELLNIVLIRPESLSLWGLVKYIDYLQANGQRSLPYEQALWVKLVYPLATVVMVLLAVPMVLGRGREVKLGQRVMIGALVGLLFHIFNQASGQIGILYDLSPVLSAAGPTLLTLAAALLLLRRVH
ncbi:MAG: LPS export ABC transporter permease LptG [Gammaproteobacteria bacterium]|nr:MAG: LPS export ABC transporter permease LptG [Gammaproteobacteria bacterium]